MGVIYLLYRVKFSRTVGMERKQPRSDRKLEAESSRGVSPRRALQKVRNGIILLRIREFLVFYDNYTDSYVSRSGSYNPG